MVTSDLLPESPFIKQGSKAEPREANLKDSKDKTQSHINVFQSDLPLEKQNGSLCLQPDIGSEEIQLYCQLQESSADTR